MTSIKKTEGAATVIGLGEMGAALARALLRNGYQVTVWNRTAGKAAPLVAEGAVLAADAAAAVSASPVVIVCVTDYAAARHILGTPQASAALAGRVLVQLSTGTPQDARDGEAWAQVRGAAYVDGAIMAIPSHIGQPDTLILASGKEAAFRRAEPLLRALAGATEYKGEPAGLAAAIDLAILSYLFHATAGFLHGARIFEAEGVPVGELGELVTAISPVVGELVKYEADAIQHNDFEQPQSSLDMAAASLELMVRQAQEAGISTAAPAFVRDLFRKGQAAGLGRQKIGSLIKVMREEVQAQV